MHTIYSHAYHISTHIVYSCIMAVIKTQSADCGLRSADTQNAESQNADTQNVESQNADTQNADSQKMIEKKAKK